MSTPIPLARAFTPANEVQIERARLGGALRRIYNALGFGGAAKAAQDELQALAEDVRRAGGDLDGWTP